ncbi:peptidoglycan-binding protein [Streptomyces sp. NPDC014735]|uniref:peptidoglycan-binding protein n=1 Tax=unclassified Streptomyces TaxID=2593676 RepID=UPI0037023CC2
MAMNDGTRDLGAAGRAAPQPPGAPESGAPQPRRRGRLLRRSVIGLLVVAAVSGGVVVVVGQPWRSNDTATAQPNAGTGTAVVQRTSLSSGMRLGGRLDYGTGVEVTGQGHGTVTRLPAPGDVIKPGGAVWEVDGKPVVLFTGERPLWRELAEKMPDGPDVKQVERNLVDLGYASGLGLTVDEKFTAATTVAVGRWQKALGLEQTGKVEPGRVVVVPMPVVRVKEVTAKLGQQLADGTVLKVTGPEVVATVQPEDEQLPQFAPGSTVSLELTGGATAQGRVRGFTRSGDGRSGGGDADAGGAGDSQKATVTIKVTDQQAARKALKNGQPGVTVTVTDRSAKDVLVVPVTALLALAEGGYGVQVVHDGRAPALVPVKVGLVANARAEISGGIREGDRVVVPS